MGEVRKHVMAAGMGVILEYAGKSGNAQWQQPANLEWNYLQFGERLRESREEGLIEIPLVFESKFAGHGAMDRWTINGKSFPDTKTELLTRGQRYRLLFKNKSKEDHPVHLHRHTFEVCRLEGQPERHGILKDTILVAAGTETAVRFTADNPGLTLFHCHQQDHMDNGFMMLFRYA
jgi:hypothetical protein